MAGLSAMHPCNAQKVRETIEKNAQSWIMYPIQHTMLVSPIIVVPKKMATFRYALILVMLMKPLSMIVM